MHCYHCGQPLVAKPDVRRWNTATRAYDIVRAYTHADGSGDWCEDVDGYYRAEPRIEKESV